MLGGWIGGRGEETVRGGVAEEESVGDRGAEARSPSATGGSPVANPGGGGSGAGVVRLWCFGAAGGAFIGREGGVHHGGRGEVAVSCPGGREEATGGALVV